MQVIGLKLPGKLLRASEPDRPSFDIDQHTRTAERCQCRPFLDPPISQYQTTLLLLAMAPLPLFQPVIGLCQCRQQWRSAACTEPIEPWLQCP